MRSGLIALMFLVGAGTPAMAQSPLDGPLAEPGAAPSAPAHQAAKAKSKPKRAHHAAARTAPPAEAPAPPAAPGAAPAADGHPAAPDDPVSLGMKWNGSNDTAAQTRFQNLNGNAQGTGAEVGLKLHF